jgi:nitrogenase subunit NifH
MNAEDEIADLTNKIKTFYNGINEDNTNALNRLNNMKAHLEGIIKNPTDYENVDKEEVKGDLANVKTNIIKITEYTKEMNEASKELFASLESQTDEEKLNNLRNTNNELRLIGGGGRHRDTMTMKDIRQLCKDNQIKLSRVVKDKRVVYKKKELLTKLKRKKVV